MPKTALAGGPPVTTDLTGASRLVSRRELERRWLLEVFDRGHGDDWPGEKSMAAAFAAEFARFQSARFCALLTNGTHALQVALETLDVGAGDEVIVPGLTWQATASAVCDVNAVPVLADVDPETLCLDPSAVERAITPRTRALIPVHLYCRMADLDRLLPIARAHGLAVIEDCAHSHGARWDGRGAGSWGEFGAFSFQSSKIMRSFEGGALITSSEDRYWKIVSQRSCGREYRPGVRVHSGNYRMTSLQAALLRGQLAALKLNAPIMDRAGRSLDAAVAAAPGVRPLRRSPHLTRETGYGFCFLLEPGLWDGVSAGTFRRALSAELSWTFDTTYTPLHHSEVYYPHTKRRHALSRAYLKAINPSRWKLPVAEAIWKDRAVVCSWSILGIDRSRAHMLTDAIAKLYENRDELRRLQARRARGGRGRR